MARHAHRQLDIRRAFHPNDFAPRLELAPALGREIARRVVELLQVQVLHIGAGVGRRPGEAAIAADDDPRHAGQRGADRVEPRRMQVREVPDARRAEPEVRVIGKQRPAASRLRA